MAKGLRFQMANGTLAIWHGDPDDLTTAHPGAVFLDDPPREEDAPPEPTQKAPRRRRTIVEVTPVEDVLPTEGDDDGR